MRRRCGCGRYFPTFARCPWSWPCSSLNMPCGAAFCRGRIAAAFWQPYGLFSRARGSTMELCPLLSHDAPTAVVAHRAGSAIEARQFLADAAHLAGRLPSGRHVLNVCLDRYHFTVGLAACLMSGRVSLLPSTHTPEVVRQLAQFAPDAFCLTDESRCAIELPLFEYPELGGRYSRGDAYQVPQI